MKTGPSEAASPQRERLSNSRTIGHIMTLDPAAIGGDMALSEAVKLMSGRNIGSLLVVKDGIVKGILTETDLLRNAAKGLKKNVTVEEVMTSPVMTAESRMSVADAIELMHVHGFRRLPVVDNGKLVGIVTETDLMRAIASSTIWKKVGEIMTGNVLTAQKDERVVTAAQLMMERNVGSIVITDGKRKMLGVITEKDILNKVLADGRDPDNTYISEVMTSPAVSVSPDFSIYNAVKLMEENGFRRLPVTDRGVLVGIVTQTDLSNAMKFSVLDVEPCVELQLQSTPPIYSLGKGMSFLIEEKVPVTSFEMFEDLVKHGIMGLCVSRTNPRRIREKYGLKATPLIWVTDINSDERCVHPNDLTGIASMSSKFIRTAKDSVIFMEALTYLINTNDFKTVLRMVQHIRDTVSDSNSCLIVSVDPTIMSEKELKLLTREMDEVKYMGWSGFSRGQMG